MISSDWVAILGPGGVLALLIVLDRIVRNWRVAKAKAVETTIDHWQELLKERETMVRNQRRQLSEAWDAVDYWRSRAGTAEYLCRLNNIALPATAPEPKRLGR
jgi:hypothetical protein